MRQPILISKRALLYNGCPRHGKEGLLASKRKKYTPKFKTKVAMEPIERDDGLSYLAKHK